MTDTNPCKLLPDQDWKTGGLNRQKYVISKPCCDCDGDGIEYTPSSFFPSNNPCPSCKGRGSIPVSEDARYFVLRIDCGPDGAWDPNARRALLHYAECVRGENPEFAADILAWLRETAGPNLDGQAGEG